MYNPVLDTFIAVAKNGSFSKAAGFLYISPVSVMKQINNFEKEIGIKLFNRNSQGVTLTPAGKIIYNSALQIIQESRSTIAAAKAYNIEKNKTIRIATSLLRSAQPLLQAWENIGSKKDNFELQIIPFNDETNSLKETINNIGRNIDLIVGPTNANYLMNNDFNFFNLGDRKCNIMVPKDSYLSKKKQLNWDDLNNQTILLLRPHLSPKIDELRKNIINNHPKIKIIDTDHFYDMSVFNLAAQNKYLMESLDIWHNIHPSLISIPMDWDYTISYGILYSNNASKHVKEFVSLVGQQYLKMKK